MSEYTKGDWKWKDGKFHNLRSYPDKDNPDSSEHILYIARDPEGDLTINEANAHLIAAAPKLVEALTQWMVYLDTNHPQNMLAKKHAYNLTTYALALAEGKEV